MGVTRDTSADAFAAMISAEFAESDADGASLDAHAVACARRALATARSVLANINPRVAGRRQFENITNALRAISDAAPLVTQRRQDARHLDHAQAAHLVAALEAGASVCAQINSKGLGFHQHRLLMQARQELSEARSAISNQREQTSAGRGRNAG